MCYCGLPAKAKGLCSKHYLADYRRRKEAGEIVKTSMGAILIARTRTKVPGQKYLDCGVPGCDLPPKARNLCAKHYLRLNRAEKKEKNDRPRDNASNR
jgi:S-ribosylhomocysteine lyase LuxS involved in autoinducer biosynthesis